jgi:hypothetical protein
MAAARKFHVKAWARNARGQPQMVSRAHVGMTPALKNASNSAKLFGESEVHYKGVVVAHCTAKKNKGSRARATHHAKCTIYPEARKILAARRRRRRK